MPEHLFHATLKMKAIRQVPEGICKYCTGTGNGEEIADLGEATWYEFPTKMCASCNGSGMAISKTEITALGRALLLVILGAIWACPLRVRLVLFLATASIAIFEAAFWRRQPQENAELSKSKQTAGLVIGPELAGPSTDGVLSLNAAIESRRQTAEHVESQLTDGKSSKSPSGRA